MLITADHPFVIAIDVITAMALIAFYARTTYRIFAIPFSAIKKQSPTEEYFLADVGMYMVWFTLFRWFVKWVIMSI